MRLDQIKPWGNPPKKNPVEHGEAMSYEPHHHPSRRQHEPGGRGGSTSNEMIRLVHLYQRQVHRVKGITPKKECHHNICYANQMREPSPTSKTNCLTSGPKRILQHH